MTATGKAPRARSGRPAKAAPARKPAAARKPGAAAGKAAPARKVPRFRGSPRQRLTAVLERLDERFGGLVAPETSSLLEKAVFLVLREGAGPAAATRCLAALRAGFIDWNEVRASRPTELSAMMGGSGRTAAQRRLLDVSQRVKDLIDQVYGDRNDTSLEFLLEQKTKERLEYLEDLDDLGVHNAYALAQWISGEDKLVAVSPEMAKAAQRLGLVDSAAVTKARTALSALAKEPAELVAIQAHLTQLSALEEAQWPPSLQEFMG